MMAKHWSEMETPRKQGRSAYLQGAGEQANPFDAGSIPHRKWATGFAVARKADRMRLVG